MDKALETQLANIQKRTGKTIDELTALVKASGLVKHGQAVAMLKDKLGMGHGDANVVVHLANRSAPGIAGAANTSSTDADDAELDRLYTGPKAALRPIHEKVMAAIRAFGPFEIAPKKTYLSLRQKKQFAMVGPATNTRVEVGLNMKGVPGTSRLEALPPGGMCQYRVKLTSANDVDAELVGWIRQAYDQSA
ncbi:MAG TPA: DUF5655 domain-containing protein [Vicinamibacterales bacterium]|nr:DUF5655 domain-containing protein [Vicinamibacterales bacterium]